MISSCFSEKMYSITLAHVRCCSDSTLEADDVGDVAPVVVVVVADGAAVAAEVVDGAAAGQGPAVVELELAGRGISFNQLEMGFLKNST